MAIIARQPARLEQMAEQEKPSHREPLRELIRAWLAFRVAEKGRQAQELVVPGLARPARDGTPAARRNIGELGGHTCGRAARQVETEAKLAKEHQLKSHQRWTRPLGIDQEREHMGERGMDVGMRIALRQQAAERAQQRDAIERMRQGQERRRRQIKPFHHEVAEMLVEPRAPGGAQAIAGLQDRTQPGARPAPHQTEMTPALARHQLENGARLPVPPHAQHDAFIGPLHSDRSRSLT